MSKVTRLLLTAVFATVLALVGYASTNDFATNLVGTWESTQPTEGGEKVMLEVTYDRDGTMTGWFWNHERAADGTEQDVKVTVRGQWKISEGKIAVTECVTDPAGRLPNGYRTAEIVSIKPKEMILRSLEDGVEVHRRRKQ